MFEDLGLVLIKRMDMLGRLIARAVSRRARGVHYPSRMGQLENRHLASRFSSLFQRPLKNARLPVRQCARGSVGRRQSQGVAAQGAPPWLVVPRALRRLPSVSRLASRARPCALGVSAWPCQGDTLLADSDPWAQGR